MGISGLLPLLKSIQKPCNIQKYAGQTIGVDAYGWLHRGTVACAIELALGRPTQKYVEFSMHRVRMLIHFGLVPYLVFDGDYLPSKAVTEAERSRRRNESKKKGLELYRMNKPSQAHLELQKAVEVTPSMARELIEELKRASVDYVVAPYEADSQLVYLEKQGIIQGMISEDSDLLVFGAKRLITKLDQFGDCIEIERSNFASCTAISLTEWSDEEFRRMAILSGCDYLASLTGMGLKNAYRMVRKYKTTEKILRMLQFDGKFTVSPGYLEAFQKAEATFQYQRVFCPRLQKLVTLNEIYGDLQFDDMDFVGPDMEQSVAVSVAKGDLDPMTKVPIIYTNYNEYFQTPRGRSNIMKHGGTPSLTFKGNQSLDSFFKTKQRTPLAELDPNRFSASPSQQQLLRHAAGHTWQSPTILRTKTPHDTSNSRIADSASSKVESGRSAPDAQKSTMSHVKRRRLLDEVQDKSIKEPDKAGRNQRSAYFQSKAQSTSSNFLPGNRSRNTKLKTFEIWHDSPVRAAMPGQAEEVIEKDLPRCDVADSLRPRVGKHYWENKSGVGEIDADMPYSEARKVGSSCSVPAKESVAKALDRNVAAQLLTLTNAQAYRSDLKLDHGPANVSKATPLKGGKKEESVRRSPEISEAERRSLTPLARIHASALRRSVSNHQSSLRSAKRPWQISGSNPAEGLEEAPYLPMTDSVGADILKDKGSEDFIVPDSDDDVDDMNDGKETAFRSDVDLKRFAFLG